MLSSNTQNSKNVKWDIKLSNVADKSCNDYLDAISSWTPNPNKSVISLTRHDSNTILKPPEQMFNCVIETICEGKDNGYAPSIGYEDARKAIANFLNTDGLEIDAKDLILCSGCSSCLDLCITVLADGTKSHNILIPKPSNALYATLAESIGVQVRQYDLDPERQWEIDLYDFELKIDTNTVAAIINNPSNPCGSVYSSSHLRAILDICYRHQIPVIADESFAKLTFPEQKFTSMASLGTRVPILVCGGMSHYFLVPGWRVGWIAVNDTSGAFEYVRKGLISLSQRIIGCNTFIQGSIDRILESIPEDYMNDTVNKLKENATIAFEEFGKIDGLKPSMPQGTTHMMIETVLNKFEFGSTMEFAQILYEEEAVMCMPGEVYGIPGFLKILTSGSEDLLREAIGRISIFSKRHYKN